MRDKGLYILIGLLIGIIIVLALVKMPGQPLYATDPANLSSGAADGIIALTTNTVKTQATILWLVDLKNSNLLIYEYFGDSSIKLTGYRDIQFDLDVPDGSVGFRESKGTTPLEIKQGYDKVRETYKKAIEQLKKQDSPKE